MIKKGLFITFEGGEGVGKTTQLAIVAQILKEKGYDVITTREPGGTKLGEEIREILLHREEIQISPISQALLFTAIRANHIEHIIKPNIDAGKIVLCDRYADTTLAYQGYAQNLGMDNMRDLYKLAAGNLKPNLTIIFDIPEGKAHGLLMDVNRFEKMGDSWLLKAAEGFREIARQEPDRCELMPSEGSIPEVTERIMKIIEDKLKL